MSTDQPHESTAVHSAFARDVFHLRPTLWTAGEAHEVSDEDGELLLKATSRPRLMRLVTATLISALVFFVVQCVTMTLLVAAANYLELQRDLFGRSLVAGLILSFLLGIVSVVWVLLRLLPPKEFVITSAESEHRPVLQLRPRSRCLGFGSLYEVVDEHESTLGALSTNYIYNLYRERWQAVMPDGHPWFTAAEDSAVPRVVRLAMHSGLGMLFLVTLFIGLIGAIVVLIAVARFGNELQPYLALLLLLLALVYSIICVLAFVQRKLLPTCRLVRWDDGSVLGEFRRDPDARKPNILSMNRDEPNPLDRRMPLAAAILLNKRA